jgi:hypothetical protein
LAVTSAIAKRIGGFLGDVRKGIEQDANKELYVDISRSMYVAGLLRLSVVISDAVDNSALLPQTRMRALLLGVDLAAHRLETLDNPSLRDLLAKWDAAVPYWHSANRRYLAVVNEIMENPEAWRRPRGERNPADLAESQLSDFFDFWMYPSGKPIIQLWSKYEHIHEYLAVRELPLPIQDRRYGGEE